jgi:hypothetical protein
MAFIGINLATGALARVSDSEAQWKRALNQAWSKLTAEQREELSPEQRSWVKWKNTLPDKEREKVTKDARRISCLCGTGTKDRLRKGAFYDKRHLASRLCHHHLDGFQQKAAGAQGAKERICEATGDHTLRSIVSMRACSSASFWIPRLGATNTLILELIQLVHHCFLEPTCQSQGFFFFRHVRLSLNGGLGATQSNAPPRQGNNRQPVA